MGNSDIDAVTDETLSPVKILVAATVGGLLGCVTFHWVDPAFKMPEMGDGGLAPSPEYLAAYDAALTAMMTRNYALDLAIIGLLLGTSMGFFASPLAPVRRAVIAGVLGMLGGAVGGALAGTAMAQALAGGGQPFTFAGIYFDPMLQGGLAQLSAWAPLSVGIAAALCWSQRSVSAVLKGIGMGILAGSIAAVGYTVVSSLVFPSGSSFDAVPVGFAQRLTWVACGSWSLALTVNYGQKSRTSETKATDSDEDS